MNKKTKLLALSIFASLSLQTISASTIESVEKELAALKQTVSELKESNSTNNSLSGFQLAGYGSFSYESPKDGNSKFSNVQFSPIFHYQYSDIVQFEGEIEMSVNNDAEATTDTALEYAEADIYLNDYSTLVVGRFLSPLGNFRQNMHPSWINKSATKPAGFGHDGAAPSAHIGAQLRGVLPVDALRVNYAVFASNSPALEVSIAGDEVEKITSNGRVNVDGNGKTYGGRISFIPMANSEIGISGALGKVAITGENERDYSVFGVDSGFNFGDIDLKAEYIEQVVGSLATSAAALEYKWSAWYAQAAYKIPSTKLEAVARYGESKLPDSNLDIKQTTIGANYLFSNNVIAKVGYEFNNSQDVASNSDKLVLQLAFGF